MTYRRAQCSCGQLFAECEGEPERVSLCHCRACKQRTGSSFGNAAFYRLEKARLHGVSKVHVRISESGYAVKHHFCPECGSTVYWYPERMPELVAVGVGAFSDPEFPAPAQEVHCDSRDAWLPDFLFSRRD
ncbi:GFA family protein [Salaquimonas pukyongi]|uniref:GFA family protein n=1 Tax=Salaquimonas pukyongi TaxID=2712698 RepID=UPI00096B9D41|nr:GFA family protein [Salaquimonas pukyongi]